MAQKSFEQATQVLKDRFGGRWDGDELEGRDEMARLLRDKLGFSAGDARATIDAMIADGTIRYNRALEAGRDPVPAPVAPPTEGIATGVVSAGTSSLPLAVGAGATAGYWQIGDSANSADTAPGRVGQVTPDGL